MKTSTNIRQWGSSAFNCLEIMFKILQDRCYGLDSKQKLYNAAKGKKKILFDDNFIILLCFKASVCQNILFLQVCSKFKKTNFIWILIWIFYIISLILYILLKIKTSYMFIKYMIFTWQLSMAIELFI